MFEYVFTVTSTPNKLVLSSAQLSNDSAPSVDSKPNSADITIVKLSPTLPSQSLQSDFYSLSLTGEGKANLLIVSASLNTAN